MHRAPVAAAASISRDRSAAAPNRWVDRLDHVPFGPNQADEAGVEELRVEDAQVPQAEGRPILV